MKITNLEKSIKVLQAIKIAKKLRREEKRIVLVGGCFDIVHVGHVRFLQKAKEEGDMLMILLESDKRVKELKGENRPIHIQEDRAQVLAAFSFVDYIVLLPRLEKDSEYEELVTKLSPEVIAITADDPMRKAKEKQAKKIGAILTPVIERIPNNSTTRLVHANL